MEKFIMEFDQNEKDSLFAIVAADGQAKMREFQRLTDKARGATGNPETRRELMDQAQAAYKDGCAIIQLSGKFM